MQAIRSKIKILIPRIKHTCKNLSLHGPSYLVRKDVHYVYRLIYFIIYIHVWIVAVAGIYKYLSTYQEDTIRFTTKNDYLRWNTSFPSVTVCEIANIETILARAHKLNTASRSDIVHIAKDIVFFDGTCPSCSLCKDDCPLNITNLISIFRSECKDLFINCTWDNKPMNCCQHFHAIQTEYGNCYSMNNNHFKGKQPPYHVALSNRRRLGGLELKLAQDCEAFVHAPDDIPYWNIEFDRRLIVTRGSKATVLFSIADITNEPEVSTIAPEVRQCRFPDELPDNFKGFQIYSYSVCIIHCRIEAQMELCNCTSHFSPVEYKDRYCDLQGLNCLTRNHERLKKLKLPGINDEGIDCNCLSACVEPDYNIIVSKIQERDVDHQNSTLKYVLSNRPYEQVSRQVAKTGLDLVVAVGNCFGLCFGGSILSIVELLYFFCFKQWKYMTDYV